MKRTIIINWRWTSNLEEKFKDLKVGIEDKVVFCWYYKDKGETKELEKCIRDIKSDKKLVLLHKKNKITSNDLNTLNTQMNILHNFSGSANNQEVVYYSNGGLISTAGIHEDIEKSFKHVWSDEEENKNRFKNVWNHYFIEKSITEHKQNLILLWMPLALDRLGLKQSNYDKNYLKDSIDAIDSKYIEHLKEEWKEIKNIILNGNADNKTVLLPEDIALPFKPIEQDTIIDYIKNNSLTSNDNDFPDWLSSTVDTIDRKLSDARD